MSADIVALARGWIGTPYMHQASVQGAGCDCAGLLRGIWRRVYGDEPQDIPAYTADWAEPQGDECLLRAANRLFLPAPAGPLAQGQVLIFRMRRGVIAKHLGIVATDCGAPTLIHAFAGHGVVESPLSADSVEKQRVAGAESRGLNGARAPFLSGFARLLRCRKDLG